MIFGAGVLLRGKILNPLHSVILSFQDRTKAETTRSVTQLSVRSATL